MSLDTGRHMPRNDAEWFEWCFENNVRIRLVKKTIETRNSNNTLTPDTTLQVFVPANRCVVGRIGIWFSTVAAADFKFAFGSTGTATAAEISGHYDAPAGTGMTGFHQEAVDDSQAILSAQAGTSHMNADFRYEATDNSFFSFDWAQNSSNAGDTSVLVGSFMEYDLL
jgi:hypothetical protein